MILVLTYLGLKYFPEQQWRHVFADGYLAGKLLEVHLLATASVRCWMNSSRQTGLQQQCKVIKDSQN